MLTKIHNSLPSLIYQEAYRKVFGVPWHVSIFGDKGNPFFELIRAMGLCWNDDYTISSVDGLIEALAKYRRDYPLLKGTSEYKRITYLMDRYFGLDWDGRVPRQLGACDDEYASDKDYIIKKGHYFYQLRDYCIRDYFKRAV